jgi:hypothetical protein
MRISARVRRLCTWLPATIAFGILIGPSGALAAPFCLTNLALTPQCMFYDAHQCETESTKQGGYCVPNPEETRAGTGSGAYCVITSQGVSMCTYLDRQTCTLEATRQHGVCYHDEARTTGTPDPYAFSSGPYGPNPAAGTP